MERGMSRNHMVRAALCAVLLAVIWLAASDTYKRLPGFYEDVIRVGVFSDSYSE